MPRIPFYIGNILSCLVPGAKRRARCRGMVNLIADTPEIAVLIKLMFNENLHSIKFVRQHTLNRFVCVVNNKYFVKVFRSVSNKRLKDFAKLNEYVRSRISVNMPQVFVAKRDSIIITPRIQGRAITDFPPEQILANQDKIEKQIFEFIDELQSIDVNKIPNKERYLTALQSRTVEMPCDNPRQVLAHFDLNMMNIFFDDDMNLCGIIDWDGLSIASNPETDKTIFLKYWGRFLNGINATK